MSYTEITKPNTPTYSETSKPDTGGYLTQENGYYILLEDGSKIIISSEPIYTNVTKPSL